MELGAARVAAFRGARIADAATRLAKARAIRLRGRTLLRDLKAHAVGLERHVLLQLRRNKNRASVSKIHNGILTGAAVSGSAPTAGFRP